MTTSADLHAGRAGPLAFVTAREKASIASISGVHIRALDGIRGIAILLVLIYHFGRSTLGFGVGSSVLWVTGIGWVGVDLFFVLSGFLITGILYDSRHSELYYKNFYARRALRIFPLYYGVLAVTLLLAALWPSAGIWSPHSPVWPALYLTNLLIILEGPEAAGVLAHYWSLAIEEHFYLLWPLLVRRGTRRGLMIAAATLMVLALLLRVGLVLGGVNPEAIYIATPARMDSLAAGALCALAVRGPAGPTALVRLAWSLLLLGGGALLLLAGSQDTLSNHNPLMQTVGYTLLAITFASMIVVGMTHSLARVVLENGVLRWFGRYSYGLYVWHPLVAVALFYTPLTAFFGVDNSVGINDHSAVAILVSIAIILSVLLSLASYHLWEQPFLRLKKRFA